MKAQRIVDGIPVDPELPEGFWSTPIEKRPESQVEDFWGKPFVLTVPHVEWAGGFRYDTYCLNSGAWDRPTAWGKFGTLAEAFLCAKREGGL